MTKSAASFEVTLGERAAKSGMLEWLCEELRRAILENRIQRGMRLPSTRELARQYGLSRGTAVAAFEQLHSEGYLEGKTGSGTYVNRLLPEDMLHARRTNDGATKRARRTPRLSRFARRLPTGLHARPQPARAFRGGEPALDEFPARAWMQIAARRLQQGAGKLLGDIDPRGYRPLREAIASYAGTARGVRCTAEQIVIISGTQQALSLTAQVTLDEGDAVLVEDPCYFGARFLLRAAGTKIIPVPVDAHGICIEEGQRDYEQAKLAYVTPAHQFPLGSTMSLERRLALLNWARRTRGLIFEDDYDSEYRYSGRPIPALQGLDQTGSVVFAGSFSKVLFPGLRLGYLIVPETLIEKFAAAKFIADFSSATIEQATLCDFMTEGHFARHIRSMRELYAERLAVLQEAAQQKLAGVLRIQEIEAGMTTVGWLESEISAKSAAAAAAALGIEVMTIGQFAIKHRVGEGLLLGFAAVDARELRRGVERLAVALESARRNRTHSAPAQN
ncbi:MAG TPA: PLP-dependent aminotransferase family protein [Candidatus Acidoferrales bacterium]|nr:PLP-dependent aminotransferase family protein [Candidatus Acidoferrales bacterium]